MRMNKLKTLVGSKYDISGTLKNGEIRYLGGWSRCSQIES